MYKEIYINGMASISAQPGNVPFSGEIVNFNSAIIAAQPYNYKKFVPAMMLRRMSPAIKMGLATAKNALLDADIEIPDAIITGTGEGCKQNTEKFLESFLEGNEQLLTPTAFIQSTHNTVGGQIALNLSCTAYNVTYSHNSASLENAFIDAILQLKTEKDVQNILVGGVDEISNVTTKFQYLTGEIKNKSVTNFSLFEENTPGTIASEGAQFFVCSRQQTANTYARLLGIEIKSSLHKPVEQMILDFLDQFEFTQKDIDLVILGNNGDSCYDPIYENLQQNLFKDSVQAGFKHLAGEYNTVSGFAIWMACKVLKLQELPKSVRFNKIDKSYFQNILIYNQYQEKNHSLILLQRI